MKKKFWEENLIYIYLIGTIFIGMNGGLLTDTKILPYTSSSFSNIVLSNPTDVTLPTEEELLAEMNNSEKFFYFLNKTNKVAHAGGGIDNITHTNSLESMTQAYENGYRIYEIDLCYTKDNHLVLSHGFAETEYNNVFNLPFNKRTALMNHDTFMKTKIRNKYTTMDIESLVKFMEKHEDVYIILDIKKSDSVSFATKAYADIIEATNNNTDVLNRFVGTFFNTLTYEAVTRMHDFEINALFYKQPDKLELRVNTISKFQEYCSKHNIQVIIMEKSLYSTSLAGFLKAKGISTILYTSDNQSEIDKLVAAGANGVMTNFR